jgi:hypothetical protein
MEPLFDVKRLDGISKARPRSLKEGEESVELHIVMIEFQLGKEVKATSDQGLLGCKTQI